MTKSKRSWWCERAFQTTAYRDWIRTFWGWKPSEKNIEPHQNFAGSFKKVYHINLPDRPSCQSKIGRLNIKKHLTLNKKIHLPWLGDILHLAYLKFTFCLFRSSYSCLFSHFNDVALAITKLQNYRRTVAVVLWTA